MTNKVDAEKKALYYNPLTNKYDIEKKITYYNPKIFSFETQDELEGNAAPAADPAPKKPVDDGEVDDSRLPF